MIHLKINHFIIFGAFLALVACKNSPNEAKITEDATVLGTIQCEAQNLRTRRFKLANDIDIVQNQQKPDPATVQSLDSLKKELTLQTDLLAQRIKKHQDSLYQNTYQEEAMRKKLDEALIKFIKNKCPEQKQ